MSLEETFEDKGTYEDGQIYVYGCVQICDEFAVAFSDWKETNQIDHLDKTTTELLEIYKQGL